MEDNILATLMIVTYNRLELTKRTFEKALSNAGCSYNLIIVDNNSEDDTVFWLKENCKNEYIKNIIIKPL